MIGLFIAFGVATGLAGAGTTAKAVDDKYKASKIVKIANEKVDLASDELELQREQVQKSLESLGSIKLEVLNQNMSRFIDSFSKLKNVDFKDSVGLDELKKFKMDSVEFEELEEMTHIATDLASGLVGGTATGALTAFGAWSAAGALASASTGTAISTLSGAAATNATLAFFGGGSLASGGLGMAGGQMVLGGFVAGPALLITGLYTGVKAQIELDNALANKAEAEKTIQELNTLSFQCSSIRRRAYMFYALLAKLDVQFEQAINDMEDIISREGYDYSIFTKDSKKKIAMAASLAVSIKSVLDTPILDEDGSVTEESGKIVDSTNGLLN